MRNRATTPLSKAKVRQSWNKYNLYNLSRITLPAYRRPNFFQMKWQAKSALRAYHGEQVREGQWERMFARRLRAVVPMNPEYLASSDGSLESAGRGSGLIGEQERPKQAIPYMNMTFAPLERRLDTAIFRALFASSARQARQFVVHGAVKVNGQKMIYPGYLLNPGDMFQVDPERVMYATGAPKQAKETKKAAGEEGEEDSEQTETQQQESIREPEEEEPDLDRSSKEVLKDLQARAKSILTSARQDLGAKRKQDLRAFTKAVKRMLSRKSDSMVTESLETQFEELKIQLKIQKESRQKNATSLPSEQEAAKTEDASDGADLLAQQQEGETVEEAEEEVNTLSDQEYNELFAALSESVENPIDDSKPYATPWRPRDYMSAFAFVPRYLEVNQNICAAVYLRHPVARPGMAEVPTPFPDATNGAAFAWYLRRR